MHPMFLSYTGGSMSNKVIDEEFAGVKLLVNKNEIK